MALKNFLLQFGKKLEMGILGDRCFMNNFLSFFRENPPQWQAGLKGSKKKSVCVALWGHGMPCHYFLKTLVGSCLPLWGVPG